MTMQMLLPTIVAPALLTLLLAGASWRYERVLMATLVAITVLATSWLQGIELVALAVLDGYWLLALLVTAAVMLGHKTNKKWAMIALIASSQAVALFLVRRFADSIEPLAWLVHGMMLLLPVALFALQTSSERSTHWAFAALVASLATLAPIIGLGGSIKMAQMLGALATAAGVLWLVGLLRPALQASSQQLLIGAQLLGAWLALSAFHLSGTSPLALALPSFMWLVLGLRSQKLVVQIVVFTLLMAAVLGLGLWMVWPEQSLY